MTRSRRSLVRFAALLLGLFLAAGAGELWARYLVSVRLTGWEPITPRLAEFGAVPGLVYSLRPLAEDGVRYPAAPGVAPFCVDYRVNSAGFRDRERSHEKPPGTVRIAAVGDSCTFGQGVALEDALPRVLEREFASLQPVPRVEVLNCGVYGYNAREEVALLRHRVLAFDPDLVVLLFNYNDVTPREGELIGRPAEARWITRLGLPNREPGPDARAFERAIWALRRDSRLADILCHKLVGSLKVRAVRKVILHHFEEGSPGWTETLASLRDANGYAKLAKFGLHLALLPDMQAIARQDEWLEPAAKVRRACAGLGIEFHSLEGAISGRSRADLIVHPWADSHPNALCLRLLARQLFLELAPYVAAAHEARDQGTR